MFTMLHAPSSIACRATRAETIELVESSELRRVLDRVRSICVHLEEDVAEALSYRANRLDVVPGLDLQLDAPVALGEVALDRLQEVGDVVVDPDRDAAVDLGPHSTEVLAERRAARTQIGVEDRSLECRLCHRMAAHRSESLRDVLGRHLAAVEETRDEVSAHHVLRALHVLGRVERIAECDALAPALHVRPDDVHEQDVSVVLRPERRPERRDEREAKPDELDCVESHRVSTSQPSRVIMSAR
jgi:hypothetical protein